MKLGEKTLKVLDTVRAHPGTVRKQLVKLTGFTTTTVNDSLQTLYRGRFVTRERVPASPETGRTAYGYTFKTDKPRKRPVRTAAAQGAASVKPAATIELMVAVPGLKETLVLTLPQVRALYEQLREIASVLK